MSNTVISVKDFMRQYEKMNTKIPPLKANMDYVDTHQYAEKTGLSLGTVQRLLLSGCVEGAVKVGRRWRIPIEK